MQRKERGGRLPKVPSKLLIVPSVRPPAAHAPHHRPDLQRAQVHLPPQPPYEPDFRIELVHGAALVQES